jgi:hypothetical protein
VLTFEQIIITSFDGQIITTYLVNEKKKQDLDNTCMPIANNASLRKLGKCKAEVCIVRYSSFSA